MANVLTSYTHTQWRANFSSAWVLEVRTALAAKHVCQSFIGILTSCLENVAMLSQYQHSLCTRFSILALPEHEGINIHRWQFMDSFITHILFVSVNRPWGSDYGLGWPPVLELYSSSHRPSVNAAGQVHRFD